MSQKKHSDALKFEIAETCLKEKVNEKRLAKHIT